MPVAWKVDESCVRCGDDSDVWLFEKEEGSNIKECYTCEACGTEWTEVKQE
jgi:DNA-directed RNA polymerase subunit M/transcription elongation factor TFIIS